ncbi:similar to Saccharomyces cerevisiae YAL034C FUN19 Non-essential protein of unknown function [Maudiozyma barnettii]|uniref:SWIRM domain-containing protein n=1 Tax=Maudiozyma barnettii TaxID=61262 RepID=A0A8H2ZK60_9SACH|nr:uncharacterized protein KABA2_05S02794 [Kazachstania barnettii]CAB4254857.1 similar to Saccharomyces cerevisiae YAL034C FUN19 Non-essential protein of unknown function [Kazachstania barnettii]CAD1783075.1 similar to Saccharomyces cerevisiae YAL034C FUN19 Non-essential protein of unknown function [Kazachstania barnettii]
MESNSPRPEPLEFSQNFNSIPKNDALLITLNRRVQWASREISNNNQFSHFQEGSNSSSSNGNVISNNYIDGILDDRSIPSPPQSPQLKCQVPIGDLEDNIKVLPSWQDTQTTSRYCHSINKFLQSYKMFKLESPTTTVIASHSNVTKFRKTHRNRLHSDVERKYRTRCVVANESSVSEDSSIDHNKKDNFVEPRVTKPRTPLRKKPQVHLSSPLASANVLVGNSNYTPNMSWEKLPDYSPSIDTLPKGNTKCLKIEWKGSPMNLSLDPLKDQLHPAELILAQVLRLPCDLYLDSKRRFFLEKVYRLKKGLPFRRTDAQKACRIDVNKASRLYAAFENVGWLKDKNFSRFL